MPAKHHKIRETGKLVVLGWFLLFFISLAGVLDPPGGWSRRACTYAAGFILFCLTIIMLLGWGMFAIMMGLILLLGPPVSILGIGEKAWKMMTSRSHRLSMICA